MQWNIYVVLVDLVEMISNPISSIEHDQTWNPKQSIITNGDGQAYKVAGSNSPGAGQLPGLLALCWPRPSRRKMIYLVIFIINEVKDKT